MSLYTPEEIADGIDRLSRQFMQPEILGPVDAIEVETNLGSVYVPAEDFDPSTFGDEPIDPVDITRHPGVFLARLSAPGYLDCTDWTMHQSSDEAREYLVDTYDDAYMFEDEE